MSESFNADEATNRTMHRMMATTKHDGQEGIEIALALEDIEAVIAELDSNAPCGICHSNPCSYPVSLPQ